MWRPARLDSDQGVSSQAAGAPEGLEDKVGKTSTVQ